ncbi:MAG: response regulator [Planctomycetes bacterium]|nr:response regulator [Planctomycetota bacterium]
MENTTNFAEAGVAIAPTRALRFIERFGAIEAQPEKAFDDITRIAAKICAAPISVVSIIDGERLWFKSKVGISADSIGMQKSFCDYAMQEGEVMIVSDTLDDERFAECPLVHSDLKIRFYAGVPLKSREGIALGTLCVMDKKPRTLSSEQIDLLRNLGDSVMTQLEIRKAAKERENALEEARELRSALELRVAERTEELQKVVANLQLEIREREKVEATLRENKARIERQEKVLLSLLTSIGKSPESFAYDLDVITEAASRTLEAARVGVWLYTENRDGIVCENLYEKDANRHSGGVALYKKDFPEYFSAIERNRLIAASDAQTHPATREFTDVYLIPNGIGSMLDSTIRVAGRSVGVVCHEHVGEARVWSQEETMFAGSISDLVALAIEARDREKIEQKNRRLEAQYLQAQKMEAVGQLTGGIAHDFNNLLVPIVGYSQMLATAKGPDHPEYEFLIEIDRAAQRAVGLIRQLMAFSRRQVLNPKILDLNKLISEFEKLLLRVIGEDVKLEISHAGAPAMIEVDPGQMEQVLMNLSVNARDAMPGGGVLSVRTEFREVLDENEAPPGKYVVTTVSDTGTGMSNEVLSKVFEPFFTTKESGKGTGLGLATSHGIIRQSGGYLQVESELGKGTVFSIFMPRREDRKVTSEIDVSQLDSVGNESILIAEDEPATRRLLQKVLSSNGYRVIEAADGVQALESIRNEAVEIDLLITDAVMPRMNGAKLIELAREIRPSLRIIMITGYPDRTLVSTDNPLAYELLQKPFDTKDFLRKIRGTLDSAAK